LATKLSEQVTQLLQSKDASDFVDVIVELQHSDEDDAAAPQTRNERIAYLKEAFNRRIAPLKETIKSIGGEITEQAWINQTLRVRVPADKINLLSDHDEVAKLDLPRPLERDTPK
jgi:hypothetical protein